MSTQPTYELRFEWIRNEKSLVYESSVLSFKIKKEKIEEILGEPARHGFEVYISDDPRTKQWRPLRFFKVAEGNHETVNGIMKWVEQIAERLAEERELDIKAEQA
jgi:hypothetical protein